MREHTLERLLKPVDGASPRFVDKIPFLMWIDVLPATVLELAVGNNLSQMDFTLSAKHSMVLCGLAI